MDYDEVKKLAGKYRRELIPMLKKLGFNASVTSKRRYWKNEIDVTIKKVPKNFIVWPDRYGRWKLMDKADRLRNSIEHRLLILLEDYTDVEGKVSFDGNIPFKEYEGYDGS